MSPSKVFFVLSLLFILILLSLPAKRIELSGKVAVVEYTNKRTILTIEEHPEEVIIFTNPLLKIKKSDNITIIGKEEQYKNKKNIIAEKIIKK